eukprot:8290772-Lingulodinium_polyedra.AAC.1
MVGAADLVDLYLEPEECFAVAGADLEACYHHVDVTPERAVANPVGVPQPLDRLRGTGVRAPAPGCPRRSGPS